MAAKSNREREQEGLELEEYHKSPAPMPSQETTEAQDRDQDCDQAAMAPSLSAERDAPAVEPTASRTRSASNGDSASWIDNLEKWWGRYVRPTVDHEHGDPRDFLALERTYLAYIRTANALILFGVTITQLFKLHSMISSTAPTTNYTGTVFGCVCAGAAALTALVGAWRYFRVQEALVVDGLSADRRKGTVSVGGWDLVTLAGVGALLFLGLFVVVCVEV